MYAHRWYSMPTLVRFQHFSDPKTTIYFNVIYLNNSQFSAYISNLFPKSAILKNTFCSTFYKHRETPYHSCVDLDNSISRQKNTLFRNWIFERVQIFLRKTNFFPKRAIAKCFSSTIYLQGIHHTKFSWNLETVWPRQKYYHSKLNNRINHKNTDEKINFYLSKLYKIYFYSALYVHRWYSMPTLVRFNQFHDLSKNT